MDANDLEGRGKGKARKTTPKEPEPTEADKLQEIGRCAYESIAEMVAKLEAMTEVSECCAADFTTITIEGVKGKQCDECGKACALQDGADADHEAREKAREEIQEDALSVEVRGGWRSPSEAEEAPEEFRILLSTGGPATRIVGELDQYGQPTRAWLEVQDWFQPWTEYRGAWGEGGAEVLLAYASCFYFGEG